MFTSQGSEIKGQEGVAKKSYIRLHSINSDINNIFLPIKNGKPKTNKSRHYMKKPQ
jgi:hypothetical protein